MEISEIRDIDHLSSLGTVPEVRKMLNDTVAPLKVEGESYEDLMKVVSVLKAKWAPAISGPFISPRAEAVFYLTKLDGKLRNQLLGLTEDHFRDHEKGRDWYRRLRKLIHSDMGGSDEAFVELQKIYKIMNIPGDDDE